MTIQYRRTATYRHRMPMRHFRSHSRSRFRSHFRSHFRKNIRAFYFFLQAGEWMNILFCNMFPKTVTL